jgi:ubiquinone/menaquinone biosynthesis C-methylase UbiE
LKVLFADDNFQERIHEMNIAVHQVEVDYYEVLHPEAYSKQEQKRITYTLCMVDHLITDNHRRALDFGAGTGNLTGKLLNMGYNVTAIDISAKMCRFLQKRYRKYVEAEKLTVINSPIENMSFDRGEFDLITCYSVLHHLPDYVNTVQRLSFSLKKGGVTYLDHEISPFYWADEPRSLANIVKHVYFHSNPLLNTLYFRLMGINIPTLDYGLSDYWHKKEHPLDHNKIECVFETENFDFFKRVDYHLKGAWILNPFFLVYKAICRPEMSLWVAKK